MVNEQVELVYHNRNKGVDRDEGLVEIVGQDRDYVWFRDDYGSTFVIERKDIVKPRRLRNSK